MSPPPWPYGPSGDLEMVRRKSEGFPSGACSICGVPGRVRGFLSLGSLPPGNAFVRASEVRAERSFPLDMGVCERCFLVQVVEPVPPETLETVYRNYSYVPTGSTLAHHYRALAEDIVQVVQPRLGARFADIGSNDGLLLRCVREAAPGARVLGIEPSPKISEIAREHGIPTINRFFDASAVDELLGGFGRADVVSATQVLQHIRDPVGFVRLVDRMLSPDGVLILEGRAYFPAVAEKVAFDTFYHELLFCFTLHSLENLLGVAGFAVFHAEQNPAYGGSLRVFAQRRTTGHRAVRDSVGVTVAFEAAAGVTDPETYARFGRRVEEVRASLGGMVRQLKSRGMTIAGYGAPSTGTTLLSYCGLDASAIDYIVDDNPLKQGLVTPGTHIPITDLATAGRRPPDYVLLIAWRLKDEILPKLSSALGGRLRGAIVPLPTPEIVTYGRR
jgi:SAM-dependent methyltransferase